MATTRAAKRGAADELVVDVGGADWRRVRVEAGDVVNWLLVRASWHGGEGGPCARSAWPVGGGRWHKPPTAALVSGGECRMADRMGRDGVRVAFASTHTGPVSAHGTTHDGCRRGRRIADGRRAHHAQLPHGWPIRQRCPSACPTPRPACNARLSAPGRRRGSSPRCMPSDSSAHGQPGAQRVAVRQGITYTVRRRASAARRTDAHCVSSQAACSSARQCHVRSRAPATASGYSSRCRP